MAKRKPEQPDKRESSYDIADEFIDGLMAGGKPDGIDPAKSAHWHAGYSAGYKMRGAKNTALNEYLVSIGRKAMGTVRLC